MKIRITFELSDEDRIAMSVATNGRFELAPRETIEAHIGKLVADHLNKLGAAFEDAKLELLAKLKV